MSVAYREALPAIPPPLPGHVLKVVFGRPCEQMARIETSWVVAVMANLHAIRYSAIADDVCGSMGIGDELAAILPVSKLSVTSSSP
jgi:hypothetical protein